MLARPERFFADRFGLNAGTMERLLGSTLAGRVDHADLFLEYRISEELVLEEGSVKKAARQADPVLLEPIMAVEVVTPEDYMGDVIGDLSSRRGKVGGMEPRGNSQVVRAQVPLAEMFGYATDLRSRTQGRATYTMQFHSYNQVPESIAREIVARVRGE